MVLPSLKLLLLVVVGLVVLREVGRIPMALPSLQILPLVVVEIPMVLLSLLLQHLLGIQLDLVGAIIQKSPPTRKLRKNESVIARTNGIDAVFKPRRRPPVNRVEVKVEGLRLPRRRRCVRFVRVVKAKAVKMVVLDFECIL